MSDVPSGARWGSDVTKLGDHELRTYLLNLYDAANRCRLDLTELEREIACCQNEERRRARGSHAVSS